MFWLIVHIMIFLNILYFLGSFIIMMVILILKMEKCIGI